MQTKIIVLFEKGNKEKIFFHEIKLKVGIDVYEVGLFAAVEKEVNFNRQKRYQTACRRQAMEVL